MICLTGRCRLVSHEGRTLVTFFARPGRDATAEAELAIGHPLPPGRYEILRETVTTAWRPCGLQFTVSEGRAAG